MLTGPFAPVSTRETWREGVELRDADTDALLNVSAQVDEITVRVRDPSDGSDASLLEATLTDGGVTILATGIISFVFTADEMGTLDSGRYEVGCLVTFKAAYDGDVVQLILGDVSIVRGL